MKPDVRPARPEDLAFLAGAEAVCFSDPWSEKAFADVLPRPEYTLLIAEEAGKPAGYAAVRAILGEAELLRIGVLPAFRGRGIAGKLLETLLAEVPAEVWRLDVRAGNGAARALYRRAGFREITRNRNYYDHPSEDGVLMLREQP